MKKDDRHRKERQRGANERNPFRNGSLDITWHRLGGQSFRARSSRYGKTTSPPAERTTSQDVDAKGPIGYEDQKLVDDSFKRLMA